MSRTWLLGEEKIQSHCRCHILSCQRFYKHLKASQSIMSVWSTRLQCSSQTPLEMMASRFPWFSFYDQVEEVTCGFSNFHTASLVSLGLAHLASVAPSPFLKLFILPFLCIHQFAPDPRSPVQSNPIQPNPGDIYRYLHPAVGQDQGGNALWGDELRQAVFSFKGRMAGVTHGQRLLTIGTELAEGAASRCSSGNGQQDFNRHRGKQNGVGTRSTER